MGTKSITNQIVSAVQTLQVERVSVASDGTEANSVSLRPSISADGRFVTYRSEASNLVPGDINGVADIFVFDRQTGDTTRISVASDGTEANIDSDRPEISADGRFVTYTSDATNLVPGDTNLSGDIFVFDRPTGTTTRVSVASDGTQGDAASQQTDISPDGRFVIYTSSASNLVPGITNSPSNVFVFDRQTNTTTRVSVASDGTEANGQSLSGQISADGRFVTYISAASNLVPGDTNNIHDVFVFDRQSNTIERVSVASDGTEANGSSSSGDLSLSADGRFVVYESDATNLVPGDTNNSEDVFVFDRQTDTTTRVSVASDGTEANGSSIGGQISADGRFVTYTSDASNLIPGDTNGRADIFVFDRQTGITTRVSVASDGTEGGGGSLLSAISADGQYVAYSSAASNLVPGDTNGVNDIFVVQTGVAPPVDGVVKDGDEGDNLLRGTHRDDILRGHGGNDRLFGLKGDDSLDGGEGNDRIYAGGGDDTVLGGSGNDWIWAGKGSDKIVFNEGDGRDKVFDFDRRSFENECTFDQVQLNVSIGSNAIEDFAELEALVASGDIGLSTRGVGLTLTFDNGDELTLRGMQALSAEDWLFA
jgi:Ca2+-binding RTX toxin-like protein